MDVLLLLRSYFRQNSILRVAFKNFCHITADFVHHAVLVRPTAK